MINRRTLGFSAAGIAALALVAAPLPALAAEDDSDQTGTLTVSAFEDRYPDGIYDPSLVTVNNERDRAGLDFAPFVRDSTGREYWSQGTNADGDWVFENLPVGTAQVHFTAQEPLGDVFFDATDATSAADIERLPYGDRMGSRTAFATVAVDANGGFVEVGRTAIRIAAEVNYPDGTPVRDAAIEFGSAGDWFAGSEYLGEGYEGWYEAFQNSSYVRHLPGDLGVRLTAPEGYRVATVTARTYDGAPPIEVTERDGAWYFSSTVLPNYFWNPNFVITLEQLPDTTKPVATLVAPTTAGPFQTLNLQVDATDDRGLNRVVANIYKGSTLVKSTQTAANGATAATHTASVSLPDGDYTVRYNASDLAGNVAQTGTFAFSIDNTKPTATVKSGTPYTNGADGVYSVVSFKLFDAQKVDKVTINGVVMDLTNNNWSDVNFIKPGTFGAVEGENTLVVYDVAGNTSTVTFTLDATGPTVTVKDGSSAASQSFKLFDKNKVDKVAINGVVKDLSNNNWSDVNGVKPGTFGAKAGENTLVAYDVFGNATTVTFTLN